MYEYAYTISQLEDLREQLRAWYPDKIKMPKIAKQKYLEYGRAIEALKKAGEKNV